MRTKIISIIQKKHSITNSNNALVSNWCEIAIFPIGTFREEKYLFINQSFDVVLPIRLTELILFCLPFYSIWAGSGFSAIRTGPSTFNASKSALSMWMKRCVILRDETWTCSTSVCA